MNLAAWGLERLDWAFLLGILNIVIIDLILAGDNAVVIAMAVRSLPRKQRRWGIMLGAGAAVVLRVVLTFFVAQLLEISFIKLAGGVLIAWIAVKLFLEGAPEQEDREARTLWQAMRLIVIADITMSTDNVLAVAGASHGNLFLLIFGLALSIPFVVFTSNLLAMLMDRYPIIIYLGAAVLGRVAGRNDLHRSRDSAVAATAHLVQLRHGSGRRGGGNRGGQAMDQVRIPQGGKSGTVPIRQCSILYDLT